MKKFLLLFSALLIGISGARADVTVTISDQTDLDGITNASTSEATATHKYGTYSGSTTANTPYYTTFTTNATSGLAGLTIKTTNQIIKPTYISSDYTCYQHCFAVFYDKTDNSTVQTFTITAPSGYYIKSYSFQVVSTSDNGGFTVAALGGTSYNDVKGYSYKKTFNVNVNASTATFTVKRNTTNNGSTLCFPQFTVTLASTSLSGDVELNLNSNNGNKYRNGESTPDNQNRDFQTYKSTTTLADLSLSCTGNSMNWTTTAMRIHTYGQTYTLTAPTGYYIKGYKISAYTETTSKKNTIKPASATTNTLISDDSSNPTIVCVDDINAQSTTFTRGYETGGGDAYVRAEITVYLIPTYTVTYNIKDGNSNLWASYEQEIAKGTQITDLPALYKRAYCSYSLTSTTITSNTEIDVTCTYSGPTDLVFASDVTDATTNNKWMELKRSNNTNYVYYNGSTLAYTATDLSTADGYQWAVIGNPYSYKLYNKGAEGYLSASIPTTNTSTTNDFTFNSTGLDFELFKYKGRAANDHFVSVVKGTNTNEHTGTVLNEAGGEWKMWCGKDNSGFECNNGLMNGLSASLLLTFPVPTTFNVTYIVQDGSGNELDRSVAEVEAEDDGDAASDHMPSSLIKSGCTYSYSPTTVSENAEIIVTYTYDLGCGFDVYEDYSDITTWYFLKRNNTDYIVYDSNSNPNIQRSTNLPDGDNASWAFVGNPYDGFKVYNKGAGSSVWVVSDTPSTSDDGASATISLASSGDVQSWFLSQSGYITNGFFLANDDNYKLNGRQNQTTICFWTNGADGGSTFVTIENVDYASNVASELASWFTTNVGNYFALSQTTYDAQNANYTAYSSSATFKQYQELKAAVEAGIRYPAAGYYRIKNNATSNYLAYGYASRSDSHTDRNDYGLIATPSTDAASVIKLTGSAGTYKISTQGLNVQSSSNYDKAFPASDAEGADWVFNVSSPGIVSITNAASRVNANNDGSLHEGTGGWNDNHHGVINWSASADNSKWVVEDATSAEVALNNGGDDYYYATRYFAFPVSSTDNCLYYLSGTGSEKVTATRVDAVPAKEGFLIRCAAGEDTGSTKTITLTIPSTTPDAITTNLLSGNCAATTVTASSVYVFSKVNDDLGFYLYSGTDMPANRAYILASALSQQSSRGFVLSFEDDVTGISSIVNTQSSNRIFDLQGRRVNNATHGLYIQNGKKVLF